MVILIDTNVILDFLTNRVPYAENAKAITVKCAQKEIVGYMAAHTIPNVFYILRKDYNLDERRAFILNLCDIFKVSELNKSKIISALNNTDFSDFEDCLQEECAVECLADYIITRNVKDFKMSRVKAITPEDLLEML